MYASSSDLEDCHILAIPVVYAVLDEPATCAKKPSLQFPKMEENKYILICQQNMYFFSLLEMYKLHVLYVIQCCQQDAERHIL